MKNIQDDCASIYFVFPSLFYLSFYALFIFLISSPSLYFAPLSLQMQSAYMYIIYILYVCLQDVQSFLGKLDMVGD